jgi:hypothetical protein
MKMNFGKPKEFISNDIPNHNNLFHCLHRYHILGDIRLSWRPISENKIFQFNFLFYSLFSKQVFDQIKMNFGKPKEVFYNDIPNNNKLLQYLHR